MKKLIVIGIVLSIIGAGLACSAFESTLVEPSAPQYSSEMYDDCLDALGSMSTTNLRRMLTAEGIDLDDMDDNDVRATIKFACFRLASGGKNVGSVF